MPIEIKRFRTAPEDELEAGGEMNAETILAFLSGNADKAYTPSDIHEATGIPMGSVGVVLSRLEADGSIDHRGEYWAISDGEDWRGWPLGEWAQELRERLEHEERHGAPRWARVEDGVEDDAGRDAEG